MPTINLYISEDEYVKLVHLAVDEGIKTTELVRRVVREFLKRVEKAD